MKVLMIATIGSLVAMNSQAANKYEQTFIKNSLTSTSSSFEAKSRNIEGVISGAKIDFDFSCVNGEIEVTAKNLNQYGKESLGHFQEFFGTKAFLLRSNFDLYRQSELKSECKSLAKIFESNQKNLSIKSELYSNVALYANDKGCMAYKTDYLDVIITNPKSFSIFADKVVSVKFAATAISSSIQLPDAACEKLN